MNRHPGATTRVAGLASAMLTLSTAILLLNSGGCSRAGRVTAPVVALNEVVGILVAVQDDRPVDGEIILTIETQPGVSEKVRVPGAHTGSPPNPAVYAMYEVFKSAQIGDRMRARGTRDDAGALQAVTLELLLP